MNDEENRHLPPLLTAENLPPLPERWKRAYTNYESNRDAIKKRGFSSVIEWLDQNSHLLEDGGIMYTQEFADGTDEQLAEMQCAIESLEAMRRET